MLAPAFWRRADAVGRAGRAFLWPLATAYRAVMAARTLGYRHGLRRRHHMQVPVIAVGGLSVGGAGKTPLASWIAAHVVRHGQRPGIVLRGVGGDEGELHRRSNPSAIVVEDPVRPRGGHTAVSRGASILVLDDAYQRLDMARHLNIAVISAESAALKGLLPAGPWREPMGALERADFVVITRKSAPFSMVRHLARATRRVGVAAPIAVARLRIAGFRALRGMAVFPRTLLRGKRILATAGIADPWTFEQQLRQLGAATSLLPWPDHHAFSAGDVARILGSARGLDHVVVTEKDAVKLESVWPRTAPPPLVANLQLRWEAGQARVETLLSHLMTVF